MIALLIKTLTKTAIMTYNDVTYSIINLDINLEFYVINCFNKMSPWLLITMLIIFVESTRLEDIINRKTLLKDSMYKRIV